MSDRPADRSVPPPRARLHVTRVQDDGTNDGTARSVAQAPRVSGFVALKRSI